jgi:hypothetical protein
MNVQANGSTASNTDLSSYDHIAYFGNMDLWLGNTNNASTSIRFYSPSTGTNYSSKNYSSIKAGTQSTDILYTLPSSQPAANQVLSATAITGSGPYNVTLGWADAGGGTGFVSYGPTSQQATLTPRTTPLFDIAYLSTATNANAAGAKITSNAGSGGNNNATGLTVVATATGTGLARAIDATGRININTPSSYDIAGARYLWVGANGSNQNTLVGNTANSVNSANLNTFVGYHAGESNDYGNYNTFIGAESGTNNNGGTGSSNTFIGAEAGYSNTNGTQNTFVGNFAGYMNTTGLYNIFIGEGTGYSNISGQSNTYVGSSAGSYSTGSGNTAFGAQSAMALKTGANNTFLGLASGYSDTSGSYNVAVGCWAGLYHMTGSNNIYIGYNAGSIDTAGTSNIMLGYNTYPTVKNLTNAVAIGTGAQVGASNSIVLGGITANGGTDTKVGIGTPMPIQKFNVENGNVLLSRTGTNASDTLMFQGTSTGKSNFVAGAQGSTNITYVLPTAQPSVNQVLSATGVSGSGPYNVTLGWANNGGNAWTLSGNSGTTAGTNFLGTTDNQAFEIHIYDNDGTPNQGDKRVMRFEPNSHGANIIGGYQGNSISSTVYGSVIAGGGFYGGNNVISAIGAVIAGGYSNAVQTDASAILGGWGNGIVGSSNSGSGANVIAGGGLNYIGSTAAISFIGGGGSNFINHRGAVISGGSSNRSIGDYASIVGGESDSAADHASMGGGYKNNAPSLSAVSGGALLRLGKYSFGFNNAVNALSGSTFAAADVSSFDSIAYFGNVDLWLGNTGGSRTRQLRFYQLNSGTSYPAMTYYTAFQAPSSFTTVSIVYTLPASAPAADGNLLLATSGASSTMSWSSGLVWDNSNSRLGINTTSPSHPVHSVNSSTMDEIAAVLGNATGTTSNQAIGIWGDASNTSSSNTGTIGVLATGNGNTTAGQTNVALQINDGEFTMGRTTEAPGAGSDVVGAAAGTAYSAEGPSGVVELTLGAAGNLVTGAPTASTIQALGTITINNRYCQSGSIVLLNVVNMTDDGNAPDPRDAAFILNVDNTSSGSFSIRVKMIPAVTNAANYTTNDKIRIGYVIVNKSR